LEQLIQIIIFGVLIILGYTAGTITERRHYRSIELRERKLLILPTVTFKTVPYKDDEIERVLLVSGNAVISLDYFKRFLAGLRNFIGGEVMSYETLIDRARREAVLRLKENAKGAEIILNLRIETSAISQSANRRRAIGSVEAIAYGTAITLKKTE
jgi:uncharacterized protein YbjQ (UPF0145 family)